MLFCKKCLDKTLSGLKLSLEELNRDNVRLLKSLKKKTDDIILLKNQFVKIQNEKLQINNCKEDKVKSSNDKDLINSIKLELEVKQLKERLNSAEKEIESQKHKQELEIFHDIHKGKLYTMP